MSIYTKTGDKGKTSLFEPKPSLKKISKGSLRIQAIGAVDEANSYLGVANFYCKTQKTKKFIKDIQKNLFIIGSILSKAPLQLNKNAVLLLEKKIDEFEETLPPLRNFLLPNGSKSAVHFMFARSQVRRAEREIVTLSKKEKIPSEVMKYINRLSDYLFCVFRDENKKAKMKEEVWMGKKT